MSLPLIAVNHKAADDSLYLAPHDLFDHNAGSADTLQWSVATPAALHFIVGLSLGVVAPVAPHSEL